MEDLNHEELRTITADALSIVERTKGRFHVVGDAASRRPDARAAAALRVWDTRLAALGIRRERRELLGIASEDALAALAKEVNPAVDDPSALADLLSLVRDKANCPERLRSGSALWDQLCGADPAAPVGLPPLPSVIIRFIAFQVCTAVADEISREDALNLRECIQREVGYISAEVHTLLLPLLTTELHVAAETGRLTGHSPEERFAYYVETCLSRSEWIMEFMSTYPVATRTVAHLVRGAADAFGKLISRYHSDMEALCAANILSGRRDLNIASISAPAGDRHRGATVRILETRGGDQVVYKPRDVGLDVAFQSILRWFNEQPDVPDLRLTRLVARPGYGWFEHIDSVECGDEPDVTAFYRRQGAHLAILYLLGGSDFFAENVRACGSYPVLLDLECAAGPSLPSADSTFVESAGRRYLDESVHRSGLLPSWSWAYLGGNGVNLSALTETGGQQTPREIVRWTSAGSDGLRQTRDRVEVVFESRCLPRLGGVTRSVLSHRQDLIAGFQGAYNAIAAKQEQLLSHTDTPLTALSGCKCRVLLRNTLDYMSFLWASFHPRYMTHGVRRSALLDYLWLGASPRLTSAVIEHEIAELSRCDIPIFYVRAEERHLYDGGGTLLNPDYLAESTLDGVRRRLGRFGESDLRRQVDIIELSLSIADTPPSDPTALAVEGSKSALRATPKLASLAHSSVTEHPTPGALLAEAQRIGDGLLRDATEDEETLTWIGLGLNGSSQWQQSALDTALYDGGHGIGLFLLMLYASTGKASYRAAAEKILEYSGYRPAEQLLRHRKRLLFGTGIIPSAFAFPSSALYLALQADALGLRGNLTALIDATVECVKHSLKQSLVGDYISGVAGLVRILVLAYEVSKSPEVLATARACGDWLLRAAIPIGRGLGWMTYDHPGPLGGFAHGASGIAWCLAELASVCNDERYLKAAHAALRFDRTLFSVERDDWHDLRVSSTERGRAIQWCHGVAGIGLGRMLIADYIHDSSIVSDAGRAVLMTAEAAETSDCLCHGAFGNLDVCMVAAERDGTPETAALASAKLGRIWATAHERGGWRVALPKYELPVHGLFVGAAGVGYGLLRAARPDVVPSVLYLEGPKITKAAGRARAATRVSQST